MKPTIPVVAFLLVSVSAVSLRAASRGTPDEAKAMLKEAVAHFGSVDRQQALSDFSTGKAPFHDRDLYVVCVDAGHKVVANGGFPQYVGISADDLLDAKGNQLGKALWDAAGQNADGSISYPMINPESRGMETKTTFYSKVADDLLCGVGAYSAP